MQPNCDIQTIRTLGRSMTDEEKATVHLNVYRDEDEAMLAYNNHLIGIHQPILVRATKQLPDGTMGSKGVRVTIGRIIFNRNIPQDLGFVKRVDDNGEPTENYFDYEITEVCGKKLLGKIVDRTIKLHNFTIAAEVLDNIKATGASCVVMDCPGCVMQIRGGVEKEHLGIKVKHIAELLAENMKH